ncbi:MAG: hypothetical protein ACJAVY_001116 [Marinoscillum sp.]|jgi:hypothetical protein
MSQSLYLSRYAEASCGLWEEVEGNPEMIVVIPVHNEPDIKTALNSLHQCLSPNCDVAIFIIINASTDDQEGIHFQNANTVDQINNIQINYNQYFKSLMLPPAKAGVGLARKIGMDEAVRFFEHNQKDGIIICYDADCICDPNYLIEIEAYYRDKKHLLGLIHHEHVLNGINREPIINYELYLRYYVNALRWSGYPHALQTLGSCITVRSRAYQKQGGMNKRKAGEDFYFIHKMVPLGGVREINNTTIYPSDRISDRVPFGTGHAIGKYLDNPDQDYPIYNPLIFQDLKSINEDLKLCFDEPSIWLKALPESLKVFCKQNLFEEALLKIISQAGSYDNFIDRYYQCWDGFQVLKYVHFARDNFFANTGIDQSISWLFQQKAIPIIDNSDRSEALLKLREIDKKTNFYIR